MQPAGGGGQRADADVAAWILQQQVPRRECVIVEAEDVALAAAEPNGHALAGRRGQRGAVALEPGGAHDVQWRLRRGGADAGVSAARLDHQRLAVGGAEVVGVGVGAGVAAEQPAIAAAGPRAGLGPLAGRQLNVVDVDVAILVDVAGRIVAGAECARGRGGRQSGQAEQDECQEQGAEFALHGVPPRAMRMIVRCTL